MTTKLLIYISTLISLFFLTSCGFILGIHKTKHKTDKQIVKSAKKLGIPEKDLYALDPTFAYYIFKLDSTKFKAQTKNHYQPLQALYFDENGNLTRFFINCYAGGFPSLAWNKTGKLNSFPPQNQAPVDTVLNFKKQLTYIKNIGSSNVDNLKSDNDNYKVFVYWNIFMRKHSKKLIKEIKKNCSLIKDGKTVKIIYINNDNWFAWLTKDSGLKW
jgi:hypothetical protein